MKYMIFCEPDPDDIAEKILMTLKDDELKKKLSRRGQQLAKDFCYEDSHKVDQRV
ncbi:MAG: hypothetical protein ACTSYM_10320 [Candidatus Baldrarchaeia archaeon]